MSGEQALSPTVIDAAIAWAVKLDYSEPTPETRQAFERWLRADAQHELAWQRAHSLKGIVEQVPPRLLRDTLQTVDEQRRARGQSRRRALKLLSVACIGLFAAWLATPQLLRPPSPDHHASTAVGERRTLQLDDGTVLILNTDSALTARLDGEQRRIVLHRGEIMVSTGADAQAPAKRPFWVDTPVGSMEALGTRFVVRLDQPRSDSRSDSLSDPRRARISVQEGAVELHPTAGGATAVVNAGESRWLGRDGTQAAAPLGFADDAWIDGVIVARNLRLADLAAELARYRVGEVDCDERIADLPVSGVFHVADPEQALRFLAQIQPVSVVLSGEHISIGPK
jgi:transmembrane sensor